MQGFYLAQCLYDDEEQCELIRDVLNGLMNSVVWTRALDELETDQLSQRPAELWHQRFVPSAPIIKHGGFREEHEWRLISRPISCTDPQWKVRPGRSMLVPYVEIKLADMGLHVPLQEIVVGPTPHKELAAMAVGDWLTSKGLWDWLTSKGLTIGNSRIPYWELGSWTT